MGLDSYVDMHSEAFLNRNRIVYLPSLSSSIVSNHNGPLHQPFSPASADQGLTRRIIACLDVRTNDQGDLVVTKGDQYDVRENKNGVSVGQVRNLGKPVDMARKYYEQGADEITFLNITSFRNCPLVDLPMLEILKQTSETVSIGMDSADHSCAYRLLDCPLTIYTGLRSTDCWWRY